MNILLAGAPSSAKTDLAPLTALLSQTPAYSLISPKGSLVGQTELRVRLQFRIFKDLSPAFGVIDEITESFQMERGSMNLDSGASAAVTAEMLNALSDSSRAGRTLLIATTNCPWRVGSAMASRFMCHDAARLRARCDQTGVIYIEDTGWLPGITAPVGQLSLADIQIISFGPGKPLSLGEGGALLCRDKDIYGRALALSQHPERAIAEGVPCIGRPPINARIHPIAALIGTFVLRLRFEGSA